MQVGWQPEMTALQAVTNARVAPSTFPPSSAAALVPREDVRAAPVMKPSDNE